jgi:hypothetical protein
MKKLGMKNIVVGFLLCLSFSSWAQVQDSESPGYDFNLGADSTGIDLIDGEDGEKGAPAVVAKPYERIILAFDTNTNLIEYAEVIEQDESSSDSLYTRAKSFATKYLSGAAVKESKGAGLYDVDKKNVKLVINAVMPAYSYSNKYAKQEIGTYQFKMTLLFKEGRYKYVITNLVHEGVKPNAGVPKRNYFEYYYNTTTNIKGVDAVLRYADKDIHEMIEKFKKSMREPIFIDEDEW